MEDMINQEEIVEETQEEVVQEEPEQEQEEAPQEQPQETQQAKNFKALRQKAEAIQRERDEALHQLQELQRSKQEPEEDDSDINLGPDELAEGKHLSKMGRKVKKLEEQLKHYQQSSQESAIENRIKAEYPDFDKIVSKDNIEALNLLEPEFAETLKASTNLYAKAVAAYKMIKKSGIVQEDTFMNEKAKALKNSAKPRPLASVSPQQGNSPLERANAFANGLSEELKAQLLKEMVEARKGY